MKETFRGGWSNIETLSLAEVTNLIVTGKTPDKAKPDRWLYEWLADDFERPLTILDFGCGMGRNSFGLAAHFSNWKVYGYDSKGMLSKTKEYCDLHYKGKVPDNLVFESEWEKIKAIKFDKILCLLVLQHIFEQDMVQYLDDFKQIGKTLMVAGRRYNDDIERRSTWKIIEEQGLTPTKFFRGHIQIPYTSDGNPEEHNVGLYDLKP